MALVAGSLAQRARRWEELRRQLEREEDKAQETARAGPQTLGRARGPSSCQEQQEKPPKESLNRSVKQSDLHFTGSLWL